MKKVLLTGARGFVGAHCLGALLERGFNVHAVSSRGRWNDYREDVEWHHADLHNGEHVLRLMAEVQPEYMLHLAWDVTHGVYWSSLENLHWVKSSLGLLDDFIESGGRRAVMAGSCAEYDWDYGYCTENLTPLKPATLYGTCKNALHDITTAAGHEANLSTAWGRLFFLYGPGEHEDRLVPSVISALLKNEDAFCTHGEQIRDYLYIRDAAAALVALLESEVTGPVNIASGSPVALKDLIMLVGELVEKEGKIRLGAIAAAEDDPSLLLANTERLNREVGWMPRYSLQEGMKETVKWWKAKLKKA
ncbi:MAG: NAD(P)-dependent oxidoreductase [Bacillota bacterium]|nr:NAD(P)-dependent oxidoreductase [Bacillota bacterium]